MDVRVLESSRRLLCERGVASAPVARTRWVSFLLLGAASRPAPTRAGLFVPVLFHRRDGGWTTAVRVSVVDCELGEVGGGLLARGRLGNSAHSPGVARRRGDAH